MEQKITIFWNLFNVAVIHAWKSQYILILCDWLALNNSVNHLDLKSSSKLYAQTHITESISISQKYKRNFVATALVPPQYCPNNSLIPGLCKIWTTMTMTPPSCRNYHPRRRLSPSIRRMWLSPMVQLSSCERWDPYIPSFSPNNSLIPGLQMSYSATRFGRRWHRLLAEIIILVVGCPHRFAACDCVLQWYNYHPAKDGTRTCHRSRQTIPWLQALIIGIKVNFLDVRATLTT